MRQRDITYAITKDLKDCKQNIKVALRYLCETTTDQRFSLLILTSTEESPSNQISFKYNLVIMSRNLVMRDLRTNDICFIDVLLNALGHLFKITANHDFGPLPHTNNPFFYNAFIVFLFIFFGARKPSSCMKKTL